MYNNNLCLTTLVRSHLTDTYRRRTIAEAMQKQEKWRRKQIKVLYYDGRPIFGRYTESFK